MSIEQAEIAQPLLTRAREYLPSSGVAKVQAAYDFAARCHAGQLRRSGDPVITHPLHAAQTIASLQLDADTIVAALLHDAIEDQGGSVAREEIRRRFSDDVVRIVDGCTDADTIPKPPWRRRKEAYIARLRHAPDSVRLVSAADKLHNARAIVQEYRTRGESLWKHFRAGRDGTLWYYRTVVETLKQAGTNPLVEELQRVVSELERLVANGRLTDG